MRNPWMVKKDFTGERVFVTTKLGRTTIAETKGARRFKNAEDIVKTHNLFDGLIETLYQSHDYCEIGPKHCHYCAMIETAKN